MQWESVLEMSFASGALLLWLKYPFYTLYYVGFPRLWESEGLGDDIFIQATSGYSIFREVTVREEEPDFLQDYLWKMQ